MSLSRKQIIYGSVLTLAAGAFVWDRATSGPQPAAAANDLLIQPTSPKPAGGAKASATSEASSSRAEPVVGTASTLRERLSAVARANHLESGSAANAFSLQEGWVPKKAADPAPITIKPVAADPDQKLAEAFRKRHLDGIVVGTNTSYAIVDHNIVYVGQTYRQFKLLSVTKTTALFALRDARVELRLAGADDPSAQGDRADVNESGGNNP